MSLFRRKRGSWLKNTENRPASRSGVGPANPRASPFGEKSLVAGKGECHVRGEKKGKSRPPANRTHRAESGRRKERGGRSTKVGKNFQMKKKKARGKTRLPSNDGKYPKGPKRGGRGEGARKKKKLLEKRKKKKMRPTVKPKEEDLPCHSGAAKEKRVKGGGGGRHLRKDQSRL